MIDAADKQTVDLFPVKKPGRPSTGKAMTNAERQARYRSRKTLGISPKSASPRSQSNLNLWLDAYAHLNLKRLASVHDIEPAAMLEKLIQDAHNAYLKTIESDSPEWREYFGDDY